MLTARGWATISATLGGLILGLVSANYLVLLCALVAFVFVLTDVIGFHLKAPRLRGALFAFQRSALPSRLPAGSEAQVASDLTYLGARGFWAEVRDRVPESARLLSGTTRMAGWLAPGETWSLGARLRLRRRGRAQIGPVLVRATGPLGMCFFETTVGEASELLVIPAARLRERGTSSQTLYSRLQGQQTIRRRGFGTEVRSLRPFTGDDDIRHVAWRRSTPENLVVRDYEAEAGESYLLVYDVSPLMGAGGSRSALDSAAEGGRLLCELVRRHGGDDIGLLTYSGGVVDYLPPGRGPKHHDRLSERLATLEPRAGRFDLGSVAAELRRNLRRPSQIFVFTALPEPANALAPILGALAASGHRLRLFVPELAAFVPPPAVPLGRRSRSWAQHAEAARLHRRLSEVRAFGLRAYRFDPANVSARLLSVYGQGRAGGLGR